MAYLTVLCVSAWLLGAATAEVDFKFPTKVFQIALDNRTQSLYVGGVNEVSRLTTDLTLLHRATVALCEQDSECDNPVRVLEVDHVLQRLLVCGANGHCWLLRLEDLDDPQRLPEDFLPKDIPTAQMRQVGDQSPGRDSTWIVSSANEANLPILSIKKITKNMTGFTWKYAQSGGSESVIRKNSSSFLFDYVDGFCQGQECLYLTLQQENFKNRTRINRLASVCASSLFPYVEKVTGYHIADSSVFRAYSRTVGFALGRIGDGENNTFVIFVLGKPVSSSQDGVDGSKGFVLGSTLLREVKKSVQFTRRLCSNGMSQMEIPDWYAGKNASCPVDPQFKEDRCPTNGVKVPVMQDRQVKISIRKPVNVTGDDDIGQVTSVFTHTESLRNETTRQVTGLDSQMTVYVLTSKGRVFKFHATIGTQDTESLDLKRLDRRDPSDAESPLPSDLRKDMVLSANHFYVLSENKLVRRPLDPCLGIASCHRCNKVLGCGWCGDKAECGLLARCDQGERCNPEISKMEPRAGPVTGRTTLTLDVLGMVEQNFTVSVCQRPCPVLVGSPPRQLRTIQCQVPESANLTERSCGVVIRFTENRLPDVEAPDQFNYTVPKVYGFRPTRMLGAENGTLVFRGKHLDSGSDARVLGILCSVAGGRNSSQIRCQLPALSSPLSSPECHNLTLSIDGLNLTWTRRPLSDLTLTLLTRQRSRTVAEQERLPSAVFCRLPNPMVSSVAPDWTFRGGNVTLRITGHHLDVAVITVGLVIKGEQKKGDACTVCPDVTDGTCLACPTPDVRGLMTSQEDDGVGSAELRFEMKGLQSLGGVDYSNTTGPIRIEVLPDPWFIMEKQGKACLEVQEGHQLSIEGWLLPGGLRYNLTVGGCECGPARSFPTSSSSSPSSSTSRTLSCRLQSVWDCLLTTTTPLGSKCDGRDSGGSRSCTWEVEIHIHGRRFPVGCLSSAPEPPSKKVRVEVIAGAAGGACLFLLLVCCCCCYVHYRKRKFYRKRQANRHSVISDGALLPSESGGSAEGRYVSLDRLLNPEGDPKKQREIEASGIIIRRRFLDLGSVVGHGNFGCVFEGHYQREEGNDDSWQKVAVKTLINPATHAIDLKTFIDEAMLMKNFDHVHVLGLLGLSEGDHGPLVVLPFMERGDILTYVKNEATELTVGDVLQFTKDIASGMEYLASSKFVHRDLAARNCMLDDDLRVKVADFGLCRDVYEKGYYHSDNRKKLPIRWMPPESIEKGTYTSKSDVWSMGVVMWEMLTRGIMPYPGVEGWDILRYLLAGRRLDQPALCPDAVYALMERCWRLEPWERPTFRDIEHDLDTLTSNLEDPHAPYATTHLLTPITIPDCHRFKDDEAIVAKVKEAMTRKVANEYSPEFSPAGAGSGGERREVAGSGSVRDEKTSPEAGSAEEVSIHAVGLAVPVSISTEDDDDDAARDRLSLEAGPVLTCPPRSPEVKDDGYFMLEQEAVLPPARPLRRPGDATPSGVDPASALVSLPPAAAQGGSSEGLDDSSDSSMVTWRRVMELRTMAGKDDGYFELEQEDSTKL